MLYFEFFMILIMKPLGNSNEIGYSGGLLFYGCFFIMMGDEINIVTESGCSSPEEESINPPSCSVSVLLWGNI